MDVKHYFMKNKQIFDIIERIKEVEKIHSDVAVAQTLDISKENLSNYKTKGRIPYKAISNYCLQKGIKVDYIMNGTTPIHENQSHIVAEPQAAYDTQQATIPNLIQKTIIILESKSVYSSALKNNIEAFHYAITCHEDLMVANKRIDNLEEQIKDIKTRLPAVGE
jgi:hypothetical protein